MKIVTDSTSDIPKELVEKYDIEIVPLTVRLGDKVFRDYFDVSPPEFYQMITATEDFPTTSQPSVEDFIKTYSKFGKDEEIVSIHISKAMSATYQTANVAARELGDHKITVIDSRTVSIGCGMIALEAAKAVKEGAESWEVMALIKNLMSKIKVYFSVENLDTDYAESINGLNESVNRLRSVLGPLGIERKELKTSNFSVGTERRYDEGTE